MRSLVSRSPRLPSARQSAARPRARSKSSAPAPAQRLAARDARSALPASDGRAAATISAISADIAVAMQNQIAAGVERAAGALGEACRRAPPSRYRRTPARRRSRSRRGSRCRSRCRDKVAGAVSSIAVIDDMRGHRPGHAGQRAKRREIAVRSTAGSVVDPRQRDVAVDPRAAVSRDVLDDRQHAAVQQPLADRAAERARRGPARCPRRGRRSPDRRRAPAGRAPARQSTVMPSSARSSAISRAPEPRRFERERVGQCRDHAPRPGRRAIAAAATARPGRPPGRSGPARRSRPTASRSSATSSRS